MCAKNIQDVYRQAMEDLEDLHLQLANALLKSEWGSWQGNFLAAAAHAVDEVLSMKPVSEDVRKRMEDALEEVQ